MINIQIMMRSLAGRYISPFVRIDGVLSQKPDIGFEQYHHLGAEKHRMVVDLLMHKKTPAVGSM